MTDISALCGGNLKKERMISLKRNIVLAVISCGLLCALCISCSCGEGEAPSGAAAESTGVSRAIADVSPAGQSEQNSSREDETRQSSGEDESSQEVSQPEESTAESVDYGSVADALWKAEMERQKDDSVSLESRISDYHIDSIEITAKTNDGFKFCVLYEIRPADENQFLIVGDGDSDGRGWITDLIRFVNVVRNGDSWKIAGMGTSPA